MASRLKRAACSIWGQWAALSYTETLAALMRLPSLGGIAGFTQAILLAGDQQRGDGDFFIGCGVGIPELTGNFFYGRAFDAHRHDHAHEAAAVNPILVDIVRGDMIESHHRGSVAIVDSHGQVELAIGDVLSPVFARSGIKPIQALALVETGAAKAFSLGHAQVALACSSHNGSTTHVDIIRTWLDKIGLSG